MISWPLARVEVARFNGEERREEQGARRGEERER